MLVQKNNKKIIACVAGRSGGHIIPCLTLAKPYTDQKYELLFFSSGQQLDTDILKNYTTITQHIPLTIINVPYKQVWKLPLFGTQFLKSCIVSLFTLIKKRPEKIISSGGYIALPVCLAAKILWIPIDLYELNVVPGKATKALAPLAKNRYICFSKTASYFSHSTQIAPYPIRFISPNTEKNSSLFTSYTPTKKTILVLGGSQGSHFINQQLCQLISLYGPTLQVIHQTGSDHIGLLENFYLQNGINGTVFAYQQNIAPYYALADLVICRSGAGTLFETLFFKKRCITIPLETNITNHQLDNALALQTDHPELFFVIRQNELTQDPLLLFKTVSHFLDQPTA